MSSPFNEDGPPTLECEPETEAETAPPRKRRYTWKRALLFAVFLFVMSASILITGRVYIVAVTPASAVIESGSWIDAGLKTGMDPGAIAFANKDRLNILCLGVDYNYDSKDQLFTKGARSDTMFVLSIDRKGETLNMVSIPRDLRVELPGLGTDKINAAYAYGDVKLARATAEHFLGVHMDHVVVIKEYAAKAVVNAVGGITIDVPKDMDYDDNWGHLHIHLKKGVQRLDGEQALGFCRFRHDEDGDRGRIVRQQMFIDALLKELKKPSYTNYKKVAEVFKKNIQTDITVAEMIDIANIYRGFDRKKIKTAKVDGTDTQIDGIWTIIPDEVEKNRVVSRLLKGNGGFFPDAVKIEVLNASNIRGAARGFADVLSAQGYTVIKVDVAHKPAAETYIEDHRNLPEAISALQQLMGQTLVVDGRTSGNPNADITIIVGQDWRTRYKAYEAEQLRQGYAEPSGTPEAVAKPVATDSNKYASTRPRVQYADTPQQDDTPPPTPKHVSPKAKPQPQPTEVEPPPNTGSQSQPQDVEPPADPPINSQEDEEAPSTHKRSETPAAPQDNPEEPH